MTYSVLEGSAALGRRALTRVQRVPRQAWRFIMWTGHEHKRPLEPGLEHINPIKAQLLKIFGPADGRGNPLVGTQYDPVVRQKIETERQHERWARQDARRHGHPEDRPDGVVPSTRRGRLQARDRSQAMTSAAFRSGGNTG